MITIKLAIPMITIKLAIPMITITYRLDWNGSLPVNDWRDTGWSYLSRQIATASTLTGNVSLVVIQQYSAHPPITCISQ